MTEEIRTFLERLDTNPNDLEALELLESAFFEAADFDGLYTLYQDRSRSLDEAESRMVWGELVGRLEERAVSLADAAQRASLDLLVGRILDQALGLAEDAHHFYMAAHRLDPANIEALEASRDLAMRREQWLLAFQLAALEARGAEDPSRQARAFLSMAQICDEQLDRPASAYRWAAKVLEVEPGNHDATAMHGRLASVGGPKESRYLSLLEEVRVVRDRRQRSAMMVERASAWFDEAPDDAWVEEALRAVLAKDPRNATARSLLDEYYEANHRWLELSRYLTERVRNTPRKSDRLAVYKRLAEVAQFNLQDDEQAVGWHREVLRLSPVEKHSLQFCVDYYSLREDWRGLVGVYESALRTRHRGGDEAAMLVQIAMLLWKKLQDHDAAEGYFRRIKMSNPRHMLMLQFYTEYFQIKGDNKRLLNVLSARQSASTEPEQRLELGIEMAEIAEVKVGNREKAIDIWKGLLKIDPDLEEGRLALRRLYEGAKKWNALLEFYKEDLRGLPDGDVDGAISIYQQMVAIYRDRLRLPVMVVNVYNQILQLDPDNLDALSALEERYRRGSRWNDLVQVLDRRAAIARESGDTDRYIHLCAELAELWARRFSNQAKATEYLEEILQHRPDDPEALSRLVSACKQRKDWPGLFEAYQRKLALLENEERLRLLAEMADLALKRLDNLDEAIELRRQILEADRDNDASWSALQSLFQRGDRWDDLADLFADRVSLLDGPEAVRYLRRLAEVCESQLGDQGRAAVAWHDILERTPEDKSAENQLRELYVRSQDWDALEMLFGDRGKWSVLVGVFSGLVERGDELELRCHLLERMARICSEELEDEAGANDCWEKLLGLDPGNAVASGILVPRYRESGQWRRLADVLSAELTVAVEAPFARLFELAKVYDEQLEDQGLALEWFAASLRADPERVDALEDLERVASSLEEHQFFVDLLEHLLPRAGAALEIYLQRLAYVSAHVLGRAESAVDYYGQLIELGSVDEHLLHELGTLYEGLGRWEERLALYQHQLETIAGRDGELELLVKMARTQLDVLEDAEGARSTFERLLEIDSRHAEALSGLQEIADRTGDLNALAEYVQADLDGQEDPTAVADLEFRLAGIRRRQDDHVGAVGHLIRALDANSAHSEAEQLLVGYLGTGDESHVLEFLKTHFLSTENWRGLADVYQADLRLTEDVFGRAEILERLANLYLTKLDDTSAAFESFRECLATGTDQVSVREEFERIGTDLGREPEVMQLYESLGFGGVIQAADDQLAATYSLRLADFLEQQAAGLERAREVVGRIALELGDSLEIIDRLEELCVQLEDWAGLVAILERRVPLLDDSPDLISTLHRVADLYQEVLADPRAAVGAYDQVLEFDPAEARALAGQERLLSQLGDNEALADLLERLSEERQGDERRRTLQQLARLYEGELENPLAAMGRYADILELGGELTDVLEAIEDLIISVGEHPDASAVREEGCQLLLPQFVEQEDWQGQLRLMRLQLDELTIPEERAELRQRVAKIYEEHLGDPESAFVSYGAAFTEDYPTPEGAESLFRLGETLEAWGDLAAVLGSVLRRPEQASLLDPDTRLEILSRGAQLFEEKGQQLEAAITCNELLLEEEPEHEQALASLERLYDQSGDVDRLVEILQRRLDLVDGEERPSLGLRLADLLENRLEQTGQATEVYLSVRRDVSEGDFRVHLALERLLPMSERWTDLAEVLLDHAEQVEGTDKAALLARAAELYEGPLDNQEEAIATYVEVIQADPGHHGALLQLDRLYSDAGRSSELLDVIERELDTDVDDQHRAQLEYRRGRLLAEDLGEAAQAVEAYKRVLDLQPDHTGVRSALEALVDDVDAGPEAAKILLPVFESDGAWDRVRDLIRTGIEEDGSIEGQVVSLSRLAEIEENRLGDPKAAFVSLSEAYQLSEGDEGIGFEVERLGLQLEAYSELVDLWGEIAPLVDEREAEIRLKMAQLCELHLNDPGRAIQEYREVLELSPGNVSAYGALEHLLGRAGEYLQLVDLLEQRLDSTSDEEQKRGLLLRLAQLFEDALEDTEAALDAWRRLLKVEPSNAEAMGNIERLLEGDERWDELVGQLEYRRGYSEPDTVKTIDLLRASVLESCLGQGEQAVELYQQVLAQEPENGDAQQALRRLFDDQEYAASVGVDPDEIIPALEKTLRAQEDKAALIRVLNYRQERLYGEDEERAVLLAELVELSKQTSGMAEGTFGYLLALFELTTDPNVRTELNEAATALGRLEEYAQIVEERALDTSDSEVRRDLSLELARAYAEDISAPDRALAVYLDILEDEPGESAALDSVIELYTRAGDWEALIQFYVQQSELVSDGASQTGLLRRACQLLEDVVGDAERATEVWSQIVHLDPEDAEARLALERLLTQNERWDELVALSSQQVEDTEDSRQRALLRCRLAGIQLRSPDGVEAAIDSLNMALEEDPECIDAAHLLEQLLGEHSATEETLSTRLRIIEVLKEHHARTAGWEEWCGMLEFELEVTQDAWDRLDLLGQIARRQETELASAERALDTWCRAFACDYGNREVRKEIERLAQSSGAWQQLIDAYEAGVDEYDDVDDAVNILARVAEVLERELNDVDSAVEAYGRIVSLDESRHDALDALVRLLDPQQRPLDAIAVFQRKADVGETSADRKAAYLKCAGLFERELDNLAEATEHYRLALSEDPDDTSVIDELIRIYEETEAWAEAVSMLAERLELTEDSEQQLGLQERIATLNDDKLGNPDEAIFSLQAALELNPEAADVVGRLDALFSRQERWHDLVELLESRQQILGDSGQARDPSLDVRIAALFYDRLGEPGQAIERLAEVLQEAPECNQAVLLLERIAESTEDRRDACEPLMAHYEGRSAPDLARIYEAELTVLDDPYERADRLRRLGTLQEGGLGQPVEAFESFAEAFSLTPHEHELREILEGLALTSTLHTRLVQVYESQVAESEDEQISTTLNRKLAQLYECELPNPEQAIKRWCLVLDAQSYDDEALSALDRLYFSTGDWSGLRDTLRRRVDLVEERVGLDVRCRLGRLVEVLDGDIASAVELHRGVLWDAPMHVDSRRELERLAGYPEHRVAIAEVLEPIYRDTEDWERLATLTEMRLPVSDDAEMQAMLLMRAADIRQENLDQRDSAFENLTAAIDRAPDNAEIRERLLSLGQADSRWVELTRVIESVADRGHDPERCLSDHLMVADWCSTRLHDQARAISHYNKALEIDDQNSVALESLDRLYGQGEDWQPLVRTRLQRAEACFDPDERKTLLQQAGRILAENLSDGARAIEVFEECLEIDPVDPVTLDALDVLYTGTSNWAALASLLERQADEIDDEADASELLSRLGWLWRDQLADKERSIGVFERMFDLDPKSHEARGALQALYAETERWDSMQELLLVDLEEAIDPLQRAAAFIALAENSQGRLGQLDSAAEYYQQALSSTPDDPEILVALRPLLENDGRWFDVVEALQAHLEAVRDEPNVDALSMLLDIGRIAATQLMDNALAVSSLNEVIERDPNHAAALNLLGELYQRDGEWARAVETLERALEHAEGDDRGDTLARLGAIYFNHLDDRDKAEGYYEAAVTETGSLVAIQALIDDFIDPGNPARILELTELQIRSLEGESRQDALARAAELRRQGGDLEGAIQDLELARVGREEDLKITGLLAELYGQVGRSKDAETLLNTLADGFQKARRMRDVLDCRYRLACLAEERGDAARALEQLAECYSVDASHLPTLLRYGGLLTAQERWDDALRVLQSALLQQSKLDETDRLALFWRLGETRRSLGEHRKARDMYARVLNLDSEHAGAREALDQLEELG